MLVFKLIASVVLNVVIFAALLFVPAGTLAWWRAWVFLGVILIAASATMFGIFPGRPELLDERYKSPVQKGQPLADKIILPLFVASFAGVVVLIPLDVFRFHLMGGPGEAVSLAGLALFIAGWSLVALGFKENAFAAPVVKHQEERRQTVVDRGVYAVVRHPMYAGGVLLLPGMALWIVFEERFLRRELSGYGSYTERVRYRLIPFLW